MSNEISDERAALPELPEPLIQHQAKFATVTGYTADQMREYAQAAIAHKSDGAVSSEPSYEEITAACTAYTKGRGPLRELMREVLIAGRRASPASEKMLDLVEIYRKIEAAKAAPVAVPTEQAVDLRTAAKDFFNATHADSTVKITAPTAEKRDEILAYGSRLRDALIQTAPAPIDPIPIDCGCATNHACAMKTDGSCWRAD